MPQMIMPRNFTVRTIYGATIRFDKDQPATVPANPKVIGECQKYGAVFVDSKDAPTLPGEEELGITNQPRTPAERLDRLNAVLVDMKENQVSHRNHFTGGSLPRVQYVNDVLGFDVRGEEVKELWYKLVKPQTED